MRTLYPGQKAKFDSIRLDHPEAVLVFVGDEKTGKRFGQAKKRVGMAVKIGGGGRNKWENPYQLWASWAPCDFKK